MSRSGRSGNQGGCGAALVNIFTITILILTVFAMIVFLVLMLSPDLGSQFAALILPNQSTPQPAGPTPTLVSVAVVPSPTSTQTPIRLEPTWTPIVPQATQPPAATNTRRPTAEASITPTLPPPTPTRTPTITPSPTATPGPSPTVTATRAQFPFTKDDASPLYLQNFANNAGCNWLGIAGEVLDLNRNPVPTNSYQVHVWGSSLDLRVFAGTAPAYGPSGWEQFVFDAPAVRDYNLQLESANGTAVSQVYAVQTRASCNQNLLLFTFIQNH